MGVRAIMAPAGHRLWRALSVLFGHGAQVQPVQEGAVHVSLEVEEEAHPPPAEEAQEDAAAVEVMEEGCGPVRGRGDGARARRVRKESGEDTADKLGRLGRCVLRAS